VPRQLAAGVAGIAAVASYSHRAGMRQLQESSAPLYERTRLFRIYEQ
jgi:hypothetical protein